MKLYTTSILFIATLLICSCNDKHSKIIGSWEASFNEPLVNPIQYLDFHEVQNKLTISIDEPDEDWYSIPGEKLYFQNDSLHFERFWGLEKYDGNILPGDSIIKGVKQVGNKQPIAFTIKKISKERLLYKIPRSGQNGKSVIKYNYKKPIQNSDDLLCSTLEDVGMDTVQICNLINKILTKEIPNIHSLLIFKDNKLVLEEYFYNYSEIKPHRVHSVTKSFTSALTGIAVDRKFIPDINEYVWKYFTDWDKSKWVSEKYDIRIDHLLSMSAGLDWKGLTLNESNDDIDMYKTDDCFGYILNKNQKFSPGTKFAYNNGLSLMLGHIIEKASGLSIDSFSREFLFKDLNITNYVWDVDDNGITQMAGGLKLMPRDMLKFGLLYLNEGTWHGKQIISKDWIKNSTLQKISVNDRGYAYHWWTKDYSVNGTLFKTYFALGHGEQAIITVPNSKLVFVMTAGNYMQVEHRPFEIMAQYILPSLKIVNNTTQRKLVGFTGEYQINPTESINIELKDSTLLATDPDKKIFKLKRKSNLSFITEDQSREIQFIADENGTIVTAEIFVQGQKVETLMKIK
jgi:CubicO group peptidase (beta-lactamase class C family)